MSDKNSRVIEVTRDFYADLLDYLLPEERWSDEGGGVCLWVIPNKRLTFRVQKDKDA